jgi:hypothetical protein
MHLHYRFPARLALLAVAATLAGCAAPGLYQWGGYEDALYAGYKDVTKMEALRVRLETHITDMETRKQRVAPGLYAELGTLYLQAGNSAKAIQNYTREREAWPESRGLMTAMIQNLERRQKPQEEPAK